MQCHQCGKEISADFAFCPHCGTQRPQGCPSCGTPLAAGFAFCPRCGTAAPSATPGPAPPAGDAPAPAPPTTPSTTPQPAEKAGERRVVTVLFADVTGFTRMSEQLDPEIVTAMLNYLFDRFGATVRRYEGWVDKVIGDAIMVLFGAPTAHEDDAERAVLTAREMLDQLPAINTEIRRNLGVNYPLQIHIGIATGLVVSGAVGGGEGGGYTVIGDAVNLASRLVDLARPGQVVIGEATRRLVQGRVRTEQIDTVTVKGKAEPVAVHRVAGFDQSAADPRGLPEFLSPLVGRDRELARLQGAFAYLKEGAGCFLAIEGTAGVGKSRLVREGLAALAAADLHPRVHLGRCISYGRTVPYYPWSQILGDLLQNGAGRDLAADQRQVLDQIVTGGFGHRSPQEAEKHRETVFATVPALLERATPAAPRILVLEDMHWSDPTSFDLLTALFPLTARAPVMLLVVYRPGVGTDLRERIRRSSAGVVAGSAFLDLSPLDPATTRTLVANLTRPVAGFDPGLQEEIAARSGGVPLFVEEILRSYVEEGIVVPEGDHWRFDAARRESASAPVPSTLHALLAARLDRLGGAERVRIDLASVIGRDFSPALVDRLLGRAGEEPVWTRLEGTGELMPVPGAPEPLLRFTHALTQEVVYATLLKSRRQELHLLVAEGLEADAALKERNLHSLAWHFEQANRPQKAAEYWLAAARQAMGVYGNAEALELFDRVQAVAPTTPTATEALDAKAQLLTRMGRTPEAVAGTEALLARARTAGDAAAESRLLSRRSGLAYHQGDGAGILTFAEQALAKAREADDQPALAQAWRQVGIAHEFACRYDAAQEAYREVLEIEKGYPDSQLASSTYNSLGEIARASDRFEDALSWYEMSNEIFARRHPDRINTLFHNNAGAAYVGLGQYRRAETLLTACITENRRTGYLNYLAETYHYRGLARLGLARPAAAAADAGEAVRLATANQEREMLGLALRLCGKLKGADVSLDADGIPEGAADCLQESVRILAATGKRGEEARSRWEWARVLEGAGRRAEARDQYGRAAAIFRELELAVPLAALEAEAGPLT